jgi:nucleoside-diphosphate-sugar epimerase
MNAILITGSAGFLGSHLASYYLKKNVSVIGIDNFVTGQYLNIEKLKCESPDHFVFFHHDVVTDWSAIEAKVISYLQNHKLKLTTIFHFASAASVPHYQKNSLETMAVNSLGLQNCLQLALKTMAQVIFASTSEIYGSPTASPQSENDWGHVNPYGPRSCYDESKRFGEALIYSWNERHQTQHGIVRIFNTYGPHMHFDDGRVILRFLRQALQNEPLTLYGNGQQQRSFCYVDDLIQGIFDYQNSGEYKPMNLGRDEEITIFKLAEMIIDLTDSNSVIINKVLPIDDPIRRKPDLTFAKNRISYQTETDLQSGLSKMIHWLKTQEVK